MVCHPGKHGAVGSRSAGSPGGHGPSGWFSTGPIGSTAQVFAEGGATSAVEAQEARLRTLGSAPPARTGAIVGQMTAGVASQLTATVLSAAHPIVAFRIARSLGAAGLGWRTLVNHAARYDFKMHTNSMHLPHSPNCPAEGCTPGEHGTITLCPGAATANCYESDLPGNLFYALIGRHVGFSELTLQLGSQFAELTDLPRPGRPAITWDTPDDTAAITLGFHLPLPLTQTALCSAVGRCARVWRRGRAAKTALNPHWRRPARR